MAIRTYCDVCENELKSDEMTGSLMYFERNWIAAMKVGKEKSIVKKDLLFCESCLDKVKTYIAEQQDGEKTEVAK